MSPIHAASLVDASFHSKPLLELLELDIDRNLIDHLIQTTVEVVSFAFSGSSSSSSSSPSSSSSSSSSSKHTQRGRSTSRTKNHSAFAEFASNVVSRSEVSVAVLLVALVYINRAKPYLHIDIEEWACERVFLGAIILANKYTNDSTLKNVHWALVTGVFGKRDVGRVEREFLDVLDWDLAVTESDILAFHETLVSLYVRVQQRRSINTTTSYHPSRAHHRLSSPSTTKQQQQDDEDSMSRSEDEDDSNSSSAESLSPQTPDEIAVLPQSSSSSESSSVVVKPQPVLPLDKQKSSSKSFYLSHFFGTHNSTPMPVVMPRITV